MVHQNLAPLLFFPKRATRPTNPFVLHLTTPKTFGDQQPTNNYTIFSSLLLLRPPKSKYRPQNSLREHQPTVKISIPCIFGTASVSLIDQLNTHIQFNILLLLFTKSLLHVSAQVTRFLPEDVAVCAETCSRHLVY